MYPYTKEGIVQCLKETCNTESPVVPESFSFVSSEGELAGKRITKYDFKTEDGNKYCITLKGNENFDVGFVLKERHHSIIQITKI